MRLVIGQPFLAACRPLRLPRVADALLRGGDLLDFEGCLPDSLREPLAPYGELLDRSPGHRCRQQRLTFVRPDQIVNTQGTRSIASFASPLIFEKR